MSDVVYFTEHRRSRGTLRYHWQNP